MICLIVWETTWTQNVGTGASDKNNAMFSSHSDVQTYKQFIFDRHMDFFC